VLRGLGFVLLALVILLVGLRLWAPVFAVRQVNALLPHYLTAEARLGGLDLALWRGRITLADFVVRQPAQFAGEPLLRLPRVTVQVRPGSLASRRIEVEEIVVEGLSAHLIQRLDGTNAVLNALALLKPTAPETDPPAADSGKPAPQVLIRSLRLENLGLRYDDHTLSDEVLSATVTNLNLRLDGLLLDPAAAGAAGAPPALANLALEIVQPDRPRALLHAAARIGPVGAGAPDLNAVLRLTGFSLRNGGPFFNAGLDVTLGGDACDLRAEAALGGGIIQALVQIVMSNGQIWPIRITGPLDAPNVDKGALAGAVLNRPVKSVENLAANVEGAVTAAASGASQAIGKGVDGAVKTVSALGGGLFRSVDRAVRGDVKGAAQSLGGTVTESASAVADTVVGTGSSLAEGVTAAGSAALGSDRREAWWEDIPTRAQQATQEASAALEAMPFPLPAR
jgi:hypothetical protein